MKERVMFRLPVCVVAVSVALGGCANVDQKTQSAGVGAAVGCAAGAVLTTLTKNDAKTACLAGAVVGGLIGYQRARSSEIDDAKAAADEVVKVSGAKAAPVQTDTVKVTDKETGKTETVRAFKSVSVDIPLSQLDTADGKEAMRKLNDYARKVARERGEAVQMTIATAPGKGAKAAPVGNMQASEKVGDGVVNRHIVTDSRIPANVQRVSIEASNPTRVSV
jgi:hypothetical protein